MEKDIGTDVPNRQTTYRLSGRPLEKLTTARTTLGWIIMYLFSLMAVLTLDAGTKYFMKESPPAGPSRVFDIFTATPVNKTTAPDPFEAEILKVEARLKAQQKLGKKNYVEVWSGYPLGGNVVKEVKRRGGKAIGIGLDSGHDLYSASVKKDVRHKLAATWRPDTLLLSPMCTGWGSWNRFNVGRGIAKAVATRAQQKDTVPYCAKLIEEQCERGGRVIFEHPWSTDFVKEPEMMNVIKKHGLLAVRLDQCMVGLRDAVSGYPHFKPTLVLTNCRAVAGKLSLRCSRDHWHQPLEGLAASKRRTTHSRWPRSSPSW